MPKDMERLATLEANMSNIGKSMDKMLGWMESSSSQRQSQHTETITRLAVIESKVQDYQDSCTKDRKELNDEIGDVRITQSRQAGWAAGWAVAISTLMGCVGLGIEWLRR